MYYLKNIFRAPEMYPAERHTKKSQFLGNMLPQNGYKLNYKLSFDHNLFLNGFKEDQLQTEIFSPEHTFRTEVEIKKYGF